MVQELLTLAKQLGEWSTSNQATATSLSTINPQAGVSLMSVVSSISMAVATETNSGKIEQYSRTMRGALASLTIISGENYLATATATQDFPSVTSAITEAALNLKDLSEDFNIYRTHLKLAPNIVFAAGFGLLLFAQIALFAWSLDWYFAVCFIFGIGLEFAGYFVRCLSVGHEDDADLFSCQIICLTIAPAAVMAGMYFLLAQLLIVSGPRSCIMKPMWFSYVFIGCDVISLFVQGAGGGISAGKLDSAVEIGSNVVLAGIVFQLVTMTVFIYLLFDFYNRSFFHYMSTAPRSLKSFFQILLVTKTGLDYKKELDEGYSPQYLAQRNANPALFHYLPLAILGGVIVVYIRCIYRVVELAMGIDGYLYRTESFVMVFDAAMIFIACAIFVMFHPSRVFGRNHGLSAKAMRESAKKLNEAKKQEVEHEKRAKEAADDYVRRSKEADEESIDFST